MTKQQKLLINKFISKFDKSCHKTSNIENSDIQSVNVSCRLYSKRNNCSYISKFHRIINIQYP